MTLDDLAPCVTMALAGMVLTLCDKRDNIYHEEWLKWSLSSGSGHKRKCKFIHSICSKLYRMKDGVCNGQWLAQLSLYFPSGDQYVQDIKLIICCKVFSGWQTFLPQFYHSLYEHDFSYRADTSSSADNFIELGASLSPLILHPSSQLILSN